jgi:VWFA-related protein
MAGSLRNWVSALSGLSGQTKSVVLFSEGIGYELDPFSRWGLAIKDHLEQTIAAGTRNNVTVYAIDPRGLPTGKKGDIETVVLPDEDHFSMESFRMKDSLRWVAGGTGGFALTSSNDFGGAFQRIGEEASQYYLLRYTPSPSGKVERRMRVNVRRPGMKVQSRTQVLFQPQPAEAMDAKTRVARVLGNALPQSGLSMSVAANAWRRQGKLVNVLVTAVGFGG